MATEEQETASRWLPEPDLTTHQLIGKLGEEAAELSAICCRVLIQGLDESNPDTGKPNRQALIEEISDVLAIMHVLEDSNGIESDMARTDRKYRLKLSWVEQLLQEEMK